MKLVIFKDNWADEIDVSGFRIFIEEEWNLYVARASEYFANKTSLEFRFGSNEFNEYYSYDEFMDCFTIKDITMFELDFMMTNFDMDSNYNRFGIFPCDVFGLFDIEEYEDE